MVKTLKSEPKPLPVMPYGRQNLDDADIAAVLDVLRGEYLTTGPAVGRFEAALAQRLGSAHAISCSSGTAALHLACLALGLGPGDAAIVPATTFVATANAVRLTGAEPVFADVDPDNGLMTPDTLTAAFARAAASGLSVKAVLPVHLAGQCVDLRSIAPIAAARNAALIEDACHAIGTYHACADGSAAPVGACRFSAMTVFSFHPVKTICAGEGGAITTNDPALKQRLEALRSHGLTREAPTLQNADLAFDQTGAVNPWYYEMAEIGLNYRLSDLHAALAQSQLSRLDHFVETRRGLAQRYDDLLASAGRLIAPIKRSRGCLPAWHLYGVLIDFDLIGVERATVMAALRSQGIGSQVHYIPVHRQPYYAGRNPGLVLPGAEEYYRRCLSLPLFVGMTMADVKRIIGCLQAALGRQPARVAS